MAADLLITLPKARDKRIEKDDAVDMFMTLGKQDAIGDKKEHISVGIARHFMIEGTIPHATRGKTAEQVIKGWTGDRQKEHVDFFPPRGQGSEIFRTWK
eukprot:gene43326-8991_t